MTPTQAFLQGCADAIAADTAFLAEVAKVTVVLAKNAFSEGLQTTIDDIDPADFTGADPLEAGSATVIVFADPVTGDIVLQSSEPLGGWHWQATNDDNLPQTIYGYALTNNAGTELIACKRFANPVTLTASGQGLNVNSVEQRLNGSSIF